MINFIDKFDINNLCKHDIKHSYQNHHSIYFNYYKCSICNYICYINKSNYIFCIATKIYNQDIYVYSDKTLISLGQYIKYSLTSNNIDVETFSNLIKKRLLLL